ERTHDNDLRRTDDRYLNQKKYMSVATQWLGLTHQVGRRIGDHHDATTLSNNSIHHDCGERHPVTCPCIRFSVTPHSAH
ncbi:hypothetical protein, partial [Actinomyces qiguomingii]|uniref:hypothetical protein n=1 Tax=Actinomyces qiguomingii TaxID=2057800 RepID=UPI001E2AA44A